MTSALQVSVDEGRRLQHELDATKVELKQVQTSLELGKASRDSYVAQLAALREKYKTVKQAMQKMGLALEQSMSSLEHAHLSLEHSKHERTQLVTAALRALAHHRKHLMRAIATDPDADGAAARAGVGPPPSADALGVALRIRPIDSMSSTMQASASLPELPTIAAAVASVISKAGRQPQFKCPAADAYGAGLAHSASQPCSPARRNMVQPLPVLLQPSNAHGGVPRPPQHTPASAADGTNIEQVMWERSFTHEGDDPAADRRPPRNQSPFEAANGGTAPAAWGGTSPGGGRASPSPVHTRFGYIEAPMNAQRDATSRAHAISTFKHLASPDVGLHMQRWAESAPWAPKPIGEARATRTVAINEKKASEKAKENAIASARAAGAALESVHVKAPTYF